MKKKIIGGIVAAILFAAVAAGVIWYRSEAKENDALKIAAGAGEELVYATINRVMGNDIEVAVLDEETAEQMIAVRDATKTIVSSVQSEDSGNTERGGMPGKESLEEKQEIRASYRIPVGTDVITSLGATTTFSHLEEGDTIAILKEKDSDAILKIWMIM